MEETTLEGTAEQAPHPGRRASSLRGNTISLVGATVMSIAIISPGAGSAFIPQLIAGQAGAAVPFEFILATVGALCIAYTIGQFTRWVRSAGSFYAFNTRGLGPSAGFLSGWLLLVAYVLALPLVTLAFGAILSGVLERQLGVHAPWWLISTAVVAVTASLAIAGLGLSIRVDVAMLVIEFVLFLTLAVVIIVKGGADGNTAAVLRPDLTGGHSGGLLLGLAFAFLGLGGFESAVTVTEETRHARRNIPRALLGSLLVSGAFFVVMTYAVVIGFGTRNVGRLAGDPLPLSTLTDRYVGADFSVVIDLVVIFAMFSSLIAVCNAVSRVMFAMGRDGALAPVLARVHKRRGTPYVAILVASVFGLAAALGLGLPLGPFPQAFGYIASIMAIPLLVLYVMVGLSLMRYVRRHQRGDFHVLKHVLIPAVGVVIAGLAVYGSYHPLPTGVGLWMQLGLLGYVLTGIVLAVYLRRRRPELMSRLGDIHD